MLEMVEVKEWGGSFQRLEDCDVFGAHLALDLVTDSKLVGAGDVSEWHQDFGVFWSKETLILWLQRPADVVSGTLSKQNEMIWKFQQMRPQKHQDRSETSDTTAELRHTNSTRARTRPTSRIRDKVLHDLPWHGPPTGRKNGTRLAPRHQTPQIATICCKSIAIFYIYILTQASPSTFVGFGPFLTLIVFFLLQFLLSSACAFHCQDCADLVAFLATS